MRWDLAILPALICLAVVSCSPTGPGELRDPVSSPNVRVDDDDGGRIIDYAVRVAKLRESGKPVQISGRCASACTLHLAMPSRQVCLWPGAHFDFHVPTATSPHDREIAAQYLMKNYPDWVRSWITAHGGLSSRLLIMDYEYARQYLRTCARSALF